MKILKLNRTFITVFFIFCLARAYSEDLIVRYPGPESRSDLRYEYPLKLLELALDKTTGSSGSYHIELVDHDANKTRLGISLRNGRLIDIIWHAENGKLDDDFRVIRIPLLKGIIGFRVFLIHQSNQNAFRSIESLKSLRDFKAGFGHTWADRQILEHNRIPLELSSNYEDLFNMLDKGRFDYFPRGINEAWSELSARASLFPGMKVEDSILLYYPLPIYFVVNKSNTLLAERIEKGLLMSIRDGSFDELFSRYHSEIIEEARLDRRKMILLENPFLPEETPENPIFWMDLINDLPEPP